MDYFAGMDSGFWFWFLVFMFFVYAVDDDAIMDTCNERKRGYPECMNSACWNCTVYES